MSLSPQDLFDRVAVLTELYLLDELSEAQLAELETLVRSDTHAASAMRTVLKQAGTMRVVFGEQRNFANRIGETNRDEYLALLQTLQPAEEPEPVHLVGSLNSMRPLWQQWQFVIPSSIAALLAIAVTLIIALSGSTHPPNPEPLANIITPNKPAASTESTPRGSATVATLTATHNAVWASPQASASLAPLSPGSPLRAGTRLTLTQGFAEITTEEGAVVILDAPTTVELLDNKNAIRLHAGKLLGICETPSSKGFLVRTPHMDVTDLGTRFGVDASNPGATEVHVLEGVVMVARAGLDDGQVTLQKGDAVIAQSGNDTFQAIDAQPDQFASITPRRIDLPGTGQGLADGAVDPNWHVIAAAGKRLPSPEYLKVGTPNGPKYGTAKNNPAISQWLDGRHAFRDREGRDTVFTCRSFFELPRNLNPESTSLVLHFDADDSVQAIRINGKSVAVPANSWTDEKSGFTTLRIDERLTTGTNAIELDVLDIVRGRSTQWTFNLRWHLEASLGSPQ